MIRIIVISVGILSLAYVFGSAVFVYRWFRLYGKLVDKPWGEAIAREDWDESYYWHEVAASHLKVNPLNPVNWVRRWNWAPKPRSDR
jgi:hypothetical protein